MAHQYMPKIFHGPHKNPPVPSPTYLMFGPSMKNINFHISDQMHFQEFNSNILSPHSAPPIVQQQISNPFFLKWVSQPQNVSFHLNLRCIHAEYPTFNPCSLTIDTFMYPYLQPKHKFKLLTEFNISV